MGQSTTATVTVSGDFSQPVPVSVALVGLTPGGCATITNSTPNLLPSWLGGGETEQFTVSGLIGGGATLVATASAGAAVATGTNVLVVDGVTSLTVGGGIVAVGSSITVQAVVLGSFVKPVPIDVSDVGGHARISPGGAVLVSPGVETEDIVVTGVSAGSDTLYAVVTQGSDIYTASSGITVTYVGPLPIVTVDCPDVFVGKSADAIVTVTDAPPGDALSFSLDGSAVAGAWNGSDVVSANGTAAITLTGLVNGGVSTLVVTESAFGVQSNPVNISVPGLNTLTATDRVSGNSATDSTLTFTPDTAGNAELDLSCTFAPVYNNATAAYQLVDDAGNVMSAGTLGQAPSSITVAAPGGGQADEYAFEGGFIVQGAFVQVMAMQVVAAPPTLISDQIDFVSSQGVSRDDGTGAFSAPEWLAASPGWAPDASDPGLNRNGLGEPVSYVCGSDMSLVVTFTFSGNLRAGSYNIIGYGDGPADLSWYGTATANGSVLTTTVSNAVAPAFIASWDLHIDWTINASSAGASTGISWTARTGNHLYVTGGAAPSELETVLETGCTAANNVLPTDSSTIISDIWGKFSSGNAPANPKSVDGTPLVYWGVPPKTADTHDVAGLLSTHHGACGAWTDFLAHVLTAEGIQGVSQKVITPDLNVVVPVVKPVMPPPKNPVYLAGILGWIKPGLPGQNNPTPKHDFVGIAWTNDGNLANSPGIHIVVTIDGISKIFDPSYGARYDGATLNAALLLWDDTALQGWGVRIYYRKQANLADDDSAIVNHVIGQLDVALQ